MTYAELNEKYAALNPWVRLSMFLISIVFVMLACRWIHHRWIRRLKNPKEPNSN
jgi:hypothetical protein